MKTEYEARVKRTIADILIVTQKNWCVKKVYHGVRKGNHGVRKVYHGVRKVQRCKKSTFYTSKVSAKIILPEKVSRLQQIYLATKQRKRPKRTK